jgi:curved DNA-binding protein CbpA
MKYSNGLPDYYETLQVSREATAEEIKRAFRLRAKEIHPDTNRGTPETLAAMRELLSAYETLINPELREDYDIRYRQVYPEGGFDYRDFLAGRLSEGESAGKLIFFDLLHSHEREALDLYDTLVREKNFDLSRHLDREDFMDCAFLIAEEYQNQENFVGAFNLFKTLIEFELERPYFKHFFQEVLDRMRHLLVQKMNQGVTLERHIDFVLQIARLPLDPRERGAYMKKLSELHLAAGDRKKARFFLQEAKSMNPRLSGLSTLEKRLQQNAFNA